MTANFARRYPLPVHEAAEIDVAIFGGGIAGLWLLSRLRALGFDAHLFEKNSLGCGQTLASQGILHSGIKYTFASIAGDTAETLSSMPKIWMDCIAGNGEIDLRGTEILTPNQCVFTSSGWGGKIAGAIASKAFRSGFDPMPESEMPEVFRTRGFAGDVFRLQEPVLAVKTALSALRGGAVHAGVKTIAKEGDAIAEIRLDDELDTRLRPRACVFAAGQGNEQFAADLGWTKEKVTQRRPLRMFMARGVLHKLYAHWLVPEPKPRLTITTHEIAGELLWYIGGNIAEKTVGMDAGASLRMATSEVAAAFPGIDWKTVRWSLFDINRAEPAANKLLPQGPMLKIVGNAALAWPTKLVLAPALAQQTLKWFDKLGLGPSNKKTTLPLPAAELGKYPWEEAQWSAV